LIAGGIAVSAEATCKGRGVGVSSVDYQVRADDTREDLVVEVGF